MDALCPIGYTILYCIYYLYLCIFLCTERVRKEGGCALVHCLAGISRSPSLVIGYLMQTQRLSFDEALKYAYAYVVC